MLVPPSSKLQFEVIREIDASATQAFAAIVSEAGMQQWIPLCRSARWRHPPGRQTLGLDSVRDIIIAGGIVAGERMVAWEAGSELHYSFDQTSLPLAQLTRNYVGVMRIEAVGAARSRLYWAVHFDTPGRLTLLQPMLRIAVRSLIATMATRVVRAAQAGIA